MQFVRRSYDEISSHANKVGLSLPHDSFLIGPLSRMVREDRLFRAQEILFSMLVLGVQIRIQTGPNVKNDYKLLNMPTIPMEFILPYFKDVYEVSPESRKSYYLMLSQHISHLMEGILDPYEALELPELRAVVNIELFNIFRDIFTEKVNDRGDITADQKKYVKMLVEEALIDLFIKGKKVSDRKNIRDFLSSKGKGLEIKTLKLTSDRLKKYDFLTLRLDGDLFVSTFKDKDYGAMIKSLDPAKIKDNVKYFVEEYTVENNIRAQRNGIIKLGNFLKNVAKDRILQIRPYKTYYFGLAYYLDAIYLDYFPDMNAPRNDQWFTLDGRSSRSLRGFREDYKKLLGGLLVDHQSFLISEVDGKGNLIQHLCAFNLLEGGLSEEYFQDYPAQSHYYLADKNDVSDDEFDKVIMLQLAEVMNQFYYDDAIIGYERIGGNTAAQRRMHEYPLWISICTALPFIHYMF
ncbi:MAG: hypothetical protein ACFFCI_24925 [Promethearchaeota archaeon]